MANLDIGITFAVISILLAAIIWLTKETREQWNAGCWRGRILYGLLLLAAFFGFFLCAILIPHVKDEVLVYPNFALAVILGIILWLAPILAFLSEDQLTASAAYLICRAIIMAGIMTFCFFGEWIANHICPALNLLIAISASLLVFIIGCCFEPWLVRFFGELRQSKVA